jgi:hypothetical protein
MMVATPPPLRRRNFSIFCIAMSQVATCYRSVLIFNDVEAMQSGATSELGLPKK